MLRIGLGIIALIWSQWLEGAERSEYASGLLRRYTASQASMKEVDADRGAAEFIAREFSGVPREFHWELFREFSDSTHRHRVYQLYYEDRPVQHHYLKLHQHRQGWVQYASSSWKHLFTPSNERARFNSGFWMSRLAEQEFPFLGRSSVRMTDAPVIWVNDDTGEAHFARNVSAVNVHHGIHGRYFLEENSGDVIGYRPGARNLHRHQEESHRVDVAGVNIYQVNPTEDTNGPSESVTLAGLTAATALSNANFRVRRNEDEEEPILVDINADPSPRYDLVPDGGEDNRFTTVPDTYDAACDSNADTSGCPNQAFDGVNAYYHLQEFRERMDSLFTTLGLDASVLNLAPVDVIVNLIQFNSSGIRQGNNAFYTELPCTNESGNDSACVIFLPPFPGSASICGAGVIRFFNLARESLVVAHEYQHYFTDRLTLLVPGSGSPNVGDAIHEGYSDYFGASHVTRLAGTDVTVVGAHAFQNCTDLLRDIGVLLPFTDTSKNEDPHFPGQTWASGLWELRDTLGADGTDQLVLKSLTFVPTTAGFVDAIEALVQADQALNAGANVALIRNLFYDTLNFAGGGAKVTFKDVNRRLVEVGLKSCSSIHLGSPSAAATLGMTMLWLFGTLAWGRKRRGWRQ